MPQVQTTEDEFQHHLRDFHELFHLQQDTVRFYTAEVVKICNAALSAANIRHIPITSRIKSWESARGSAMRRQQERLFWQRVYPRATTVEPAWVEYCRLRGLEQRDFRPIHSAKEILEGLHDIGGVRISLYFPGNVAKVINVLKSRLHVLRVTEKGQNQINTKYLKDFLEDLDRDGTDKHTVSIEKSSGYERTFGGYKASHLVVKLREEDIPENKQCAWKDTVVEIQVGTLVMHMWSEIEHDMIYKPLESQGDEVSEDEKRVLDLINGIVMTGEAALRQLEASTEERLNQRAKDQAAFASSEYELVLWIENYYKKKGKPLAQGEWELQDQLYAILQVNGDHQHGKVEVLLERIQAPVTPTRRELSGMILDVLCAGPGLRQPLSSSKSSEAEDQTIAHARLWGMRFLQSLNMAIYLGVGEQFVDSSGMELIPPSLTNFLDLMHPCSPYPVDIVNAHKIANYCQRIINQKRNLLERVSTNLPQAGYIVCADSVQDANSVVVPGMLSKVFPPHDVTETDPQGILDFIDDYIHRDQFDDDKLVLWDRLTSSSHDQARRKPLVERAFVSQVPPWQDKGAWKLEDLRVEIKAAKWDTFEAEQTPTPILPLPEADNSTPGIMRLAYRLYPQTQWNNVKKAWRVADALRPTAKPRKEGGKLDYRSIYD
ncbi:hypothetical protein F5X99DRAFT_401374 [Biscogniauxia marginata]|nr:hypothetical protein F5X99DRAFT_401374 [Biscogniauxia marginata]